MNSNNVLRFLTENIKINIKSLERDPVTETDLI